MRGIGQSLGISGILSATLIIFVGSTVVLTLLELFRNLAMSCEWNGVPALLSRYTLTVFDTSLAVVSVVVAVILNSPAPEIVYKAF
jgi:alginate O-acetyltransferase complex protein AlgI